MPPSESLLRTDSLSSAEPVLSDGSVGSAPSLGLSPGPIDIGRNEMNQTQDKMMKHQQKAVEVKSTHEKFKEKLMSLQRVLSCDCPALSARLCWQSSFY